MTRQTWTAFVSAVIFVGLAMLLALVPVPFVTWSPGGTRDILGTVDGEPVIEVSGITSYPTSGRLDLTILSVTSADHSLTLPEAVLSYWLPGRDTLPRDAVYAPGRSAQELDREDADRMETAQDDAVVAALRAAGEPVTEMPVIASVTVGAPAHGRLLPGDLVVSVDGMTTPDVDSVGNRIRSHRIGDEVSFVVLRDRVATTVTVATAESTTRPGTPAIGVTVGVGYRYEPRISFDVGQQLGGPSAGLVFALAIYDKITKGPLLADRHVAGTGQITPSGDVGAVGGVQQKLAAAEKAGATVFLVPAASCANLSGVTTRLQVVAVSSLDEAITALRTLPERSGEPEPVGCR